MSRRLFVRKIISIGAVESPDNPEATIRLWKQKPDDGEAPKQVSKKNPYKEWLASQDEQIAALRETDAHIKQQIKDYKSEREAYAMSQKETVEDVVGRIDRIADTIMQEQGLSKAEAKAQAWRDNPDLVAKSRSAPKSTVKAVLTISDRVRVVIDEAADEASWKPLLKDWGKSRSREEIMRGVRVEMWRTPEGQALRDLDRAKGSEPYTPSSVVKIRKSKNGDGFAKALGLLESGLPKVG